MCDPTLGTTNATVVLGRCPPLWRDLIRQLLQPEFDVVESPPVPTDGQISSAAPTNVVAYLAFDEAVDDIARRSATCRVPCVLVSGDSRRAMRFRAGVRDRDVDNVSPHGLRSLLRG
ncbi:MAG: hypothetical protein IT360_16505 [Gemmatimonadaceae bacterium]|nr:hypothetical protein [Gemmatimonadaceae bacterium]